MQVFLARLRLDVGGSRHVPPPSRPWVMPLAFDHNRADFTANQLQRKNSPYSAVLHKAFVDVNEEREPRPPPQLES